MHSSWIFPRDNEWIFRGYRALMDLGSNSGLCLPAEAGLRPLRILAVFWNPGRL